MKLDKYSLFSFSYILIIGFLLFAIFVIYPEDWLVNLSYLLVIVSFTSIFHFALDKVMKELRKGNKDETIIEHFILFAYSYVVWLILYIFAFRLPFDINSILFDFAFVITMTYISSFITRMIIGEFRLINDISVYVIALIIPIILKYSWNVYYWIIPLVFGIFMAIFLIKYKIYDN